MNWQQLKHFETLASVGHYRKAAERLYIAIPTLSKSISNLEKELGVPLFFKRDNELCLTIYGKVLRVHVRKTLQEIEDGLREIRMLSGNNSGVVRIGSIFTVASGYLPNVIKRFAEDFPEVNFEMCQQTTKQNLDDLYQDNIDLAFTAIVDSFETHYGSYAFCKEVVYNEEILLVMSENHPLANRELLSFTDVATEKFISYNSKTGIVSAINDAIRAAGYSPDITVSYYANEENAILGMVRAGLGIAFVCNSPNLNFIGIRLFSLSDVFIYRPVYLVWKNNIYMPPVVSRFKNFVLSHARLALADSLPTAKAPRKGGKRTLQI